ncbi:MAG: very short patch repair endonuclease [Syntrophobacteraceae bacterium]
MQCQCRLEGDDEPGGFLLHGLIAVKHRLRTKRDVTDILSTKQRSITMSKVRSGDTKPEWILRAGLHRLGFRYRLRNKHLPGQPDLAFPKFHAVVFVHGCYWHRHPECKDASMPKSNVDFWTRKFAENVERDRRTEEQLSAMGWRVMVVWQCGLVKRTVETIRKVALWLKEGAASGDQFGYGGPIMDRAELLAVAEKRVRFRIASYKKKSNLSGAEGKEGDQ